METTINMSIINKGIPTERSTHEPWVQLDRVSGKGGGPRLTDRERNLGCTVRIKLRVLQTVTLK